MTETLKKIADLAVSIRSLSDEYILNKFNDNPSDFREAMFDVLEKAVGSFPKYFQHVVSMESMMAVRRARIIDKETANDYRDFVSDLDRRRRELHIGVADSVNQVNRLCKICEMDPVFVFPQVKDNLLLPESEDKYVASSHRELAADSVFAFCKDVYLDSQSREKLQELGHAPAQDELYDIIKISGAFSKNVSIDDLIKAATADSLNENENSSAHSHQKIDERER